MSSEDEENGVAESAESFDGAWKRGLSARKS